MAKQNVPTVVLVKGAKVNFRAGSARAEYYARLAEFNNKPLADFIASCESNPPSMPTKGKLAGKPEPVSGWVSYFTRNGYAEIKQA